MGRIFFRIVDALFASWTATVLIYASIVYAVTAEIAYDNTLVAFSTLIGALITIPWGISILIVIRDALMDDRKPRPSSDEKRECLPI